MLHAELHDKLNEDTPAPARIEDTLTSTVFGTLLLPVGGINVLCTWLSRARRVGSENGIDAPIPPVAPADPVAYWFWQHIGGGEPDLLLRIGDRLFIIEAKYHSGKSGGGDEDDLADVGLPKKDQLAKYWVACQPGTGRESYPPDLSDAILQCDRNLVYVVSFANHFHRSLDEVRESESVLAAETGGTVPVFLVTWQDLHRALVLLNRQTQPAPVQWVGELAQLLELRGLAAFIGFPQSWTSCRSDTNEPVSEWASNWPLAQPRPPCQVLDKIDLESVTGLASAASWLPSSWIASQRHRLQSTLDGLSLDAVGRIALRGWWSNEPASRWSDLDGLGLDLDAIGVVVATVWWRAMSAESGEVT